MFRNWAIYSLGILKSDHWVVVLNHFAFWCTTFHGTWDLGTAKVFKTSSKGSRGKFSKEKPKPDALLALEFAATCQTYSPDSGWTLKRLLDVMGTCSPYLSCDTSKFDF